MGRDALHIGPNGSGATLKLINNFLCAVQAASLAEAVAMIENSGLDAGKAMTVLTDGAPGSPLVKGIAPRMAGRDYTVNFALSLMRKDIGYAIAAADRHGVSLATAAAARQRYDQAIDGGYGNDDFSAVVEPLREAAAARRPGDLRPDGGGRREKTRAGPGGQGE
jgi:3-hydroxyisobutyrate dehydrogenase